MNEHKLARDRYNPEVEGAIDSMELAFRMQHDVPDVLDLSSETQATLRDYGIGREPTDRFGRQCLMARRLIEAGVRFRRSHRTGQLGSSSVAEDTARQCLRGHRWSDRFLT